jgi:hypothetical protein
MQSCALSSLVLYTNVYICKVHILQYLPHNLGINFLGVADVEASHSLLVRASVVKINTSVGPSFCRLASLWRIEVPFTFPLCS